VKRIQKRIIEADIAALVLESFREFEAPFVAVRSSATAEDSASAAWAGQLDSFLNTTEETLFLNVKRCWASLFTAARHIVQSRPITTLS
jgi:phosphoenolpyruvate synthase/pyruvate phosphate dikinase